MKTWAPANFMTSCWRASRLIVLCHVHEVVISLAGATKWFLIPNTRQLLHQKHQRKRNINISSIKPLPSALSRKFWCTKNQMFWDRNLCFSIDFGDLFAKNIIKYRAKARCISHNKAPIAQVVKPKANQTSLTTQRLAKHPSQPKQTNTTKPIKTQNVPTVSKAYIYSIYKSQRLQIILSLLFETKQNTNNISPP